MAVNESRLKEGTLTLGGTGGTGGVEFACQPTNVRVTPSHDETGDEVETLCGDKLAADTKTSWALAGTSIQDFDSPEGFVQFSVENNLDVVEFTWQPNAGAFEVAGEVQVRACEIGGDVNTRITTDFEWPCQNDPEFTWPPVVPLAAQAEPTGEPESEAEPTAEPEPEAEPPAEPEPTTEPESEPPLEGEPPVEGEPAGPAYGP